LLRRQTRHLQEKQLLLKQENVLRKFQSGALQSSQSVVGEYVIAEGGNPLTGDDEEPRDTVINYPSRNEGVPFQMMTRGVNRQGKYYRLTTFVSSVEITHLMIAVLGSQLLIYLILFYSIVRINKRLSNTIWQPFYQTMQALEGYDVHTNQALPRQPPTGISEFDELNRVLQALSERTQQAYRNQKQFVENASHEIQTPLAVIRSKVELLMEQPDLTEEGAELILEIAGANNRLSRLNKTLLLLSKIENNQFLEKTALNLTGLIRQNLDHFNRYYLENMPAVRVELEENVCLVANSELLDILCSNVIRNAIVHNVPGGHLAVTLNQERLTVENPGPPLQMEPGLLFERFRTGDDKAKKTTGLGLALVKQISDLYGYQAAYTYHDPLHRLTINFSRA
jgi:signal transduction histidine kinase